MGCQPHPALDGRIDDVTIDPLILSTERCVVRPLTDDDTDELMVYRNDLNWMRYQGLKGLTREEWVQQLLSSKNVDDGLQLAVMSRLSGQLIGDLYVRCDAETCWIGYTISPKYARQGHATEAVTALIEELTWRGVQCIKAGVSPDNKASIKLLTKLGFHLTDSSDDEETYTLLLQSSSSLPPGIRFVARPNGYRSAALVGDQRSGRWQRRGCKTSLKSGPSKT